MPGWQLRPNSYSLSGPQAFTALRSLHADRLYLGVDSPDPDTGLMTPHLRKRSARDVGGGSYRAVP